MAPVPALDRLTLSVREREIVGLVGPSGCGKSTALKLVASLAEPTGGAIFVPGSKRSRLGAFTFMPQGDSLLPWRSALDNASLLLEVHGAPRATARRQAREALESVGLGEFAAQLPSELSGGMRRRVALVRSFLPELPVLLDEPFGALDAITRLDIQGWLLRLHERLPRAILLVTHDVDEAVYLADRVYVMSPRPGRVIHEVSIDLGRPRSEDVIGSSEFAAARAALLREIRRGMGREAA